jgi:hypothetical protein
VTRQIYTKGLSVFEPDRAAGPPVPWRHSDAEAGTAEYVKGIAKGGGDPEDPIDVAAPRASQSRLPSDEFVERVV